MLAEFLGYGEENAKTGRELQKALHLSAREVMAVVERERRAGEPICASQNKAHPGYYLATKKSEVTQYCRSLKHRAGEIFKTRRALLDTAEKMEE